MLKFIKSNLTNLLKFKAEKPKYYRFRLDETGYKHQCPACKQKALVLYIDYDVNQPMDPNHEAGRCDREHKCGYHYPPKTFLYKNPGFKPKPGYKRHRFRIIEDTAPSFIPQEIMQNSLRNHDGNRLLFFLKKKFGKKKVEKMLEMYHVGKLDEWGDDNAVFWQVDVNSNVRAGKIMWYDCETGKRRKSKNEICQIGWIHSMLKLPDFNLDQCFYGEKLVPLHPEKIIFIVESEKTALIASMYYPEYVWLACGGSNGLSAKKFKVLRNRKVILLPDHGMYEKWLEKSKTLNHVGSLQVSDWLERIREERYDLEDGFDIADVILADLTAEEMENEDDCGNEDEFINNKNN
jgi:hypothetical protein